MGMTEKLTKSLLTAKSKPHKGEHFFDQLDAAVTTWKKSATSDIQQLPDPALVATGESLEESPYTKEFFRAKLTSLVDNFDEVRKIGLVTLDQQQALVAVHVRHPSGRVRIALAYPTTKLVENRAPKLSTEPGDDYREVLDGNYRFHRWVDASLISTVPNLPATKLLSSNDRRWHGKDGSPEIPPDLARWHADPRDTDDVNMFSVDKNPFVPAASR
jgi:hypothetical protein